MNPESLMAWLLYGVPTVGLMALYLWRRTRRAATDRDRLERAVDAGMTEPPSLHPVVDPLRCIGSASCLPACPEGAIGMVKGKAHLVDPTACIGHGACEAACPVHAISLVFGTERRGIDIPKVNPDFETNVPGLFIAGELGGMGLIRKACEQGRQAVETLSRRRAQGDELDVLIVGCGPAGIAAGLGAIEAGLRYRLIEQEQALGGSVFHYPRHKLTMTAPVTLPIVGKLKVGEISKEELLARWTEIVARAGLRIDFGVRLDDVLPEGTGFRVVTSVGEIRARSVLLAIGRRGSPRRLDVAGEDSAKVVYRLIDPEQYRGKKVLVVGGGDSAVEAALMCSEQPGTAVALSYRSQAFSRIKAANRDALARAQLEGRIETLLGTTVEEVAADHVVINNGSQRVSLANDAVIVNIGGQLPFDLLRRLGIDVATKHGEL